jgi:large subunit ribosomal protein L9
MKVLLIKDVYKLGRAGDLKKVADGYGRNFLLPQGLAVLATPGAIKQADYIREKATEQRAVINKEMGAVAEQLQKVSLSFAARAGETGKLYGSITSQDVVDQIEKQSGIIIKRQIVDMQPLRTLGEHTIQVRLTMDLIPELKVLVYREGETASSESTGLTESGKITDKPASEVADEVIDNQVEETVVVMEETVEPLDESIEDAEEPDPVEETELEE